MNINEINYSQVTINNYTAAPGAVNGAAENTAADKSRTGDVITNETTFGELLKILMRFPEAMEAAQIEAKAKRDKEKLAKIREKLGAEVGGELDGDEIAYMQCKETTAEKLRRPGAIKLRQSGVLLANFLMGDNGKIEVYTNAYGIYDNGNRKAVIWIPTCGRAVYNFTPLRENEKLYMNESTVIDEDVMAGFPWYHVLTVAGENRIAFNLTRAKHRGTASDLDTAYELETKSFQVQLGCARFEDPETAYLRKEAREERLTKLTERQHEVYELYFEQGYTMQEIADMLGISWRGVAYHLEAIRSLFKKIN